MKTFTLFLGFLFIVKVVNAQIDEKRNSIMAETNLIMSLSISYDRIIPIHEKTAFMFGGGYIMGIGFGYGSNWLLTEVNLLSFGPKHFLETGAQFVFGIDDDSSPGLKLSYRFQGSKGITLRATVNAFFNIDPIIFPAVGIGYSF